MNIMTVIQAGELLRDAGLKRTPQRAAVLDYLARAGTHPTADEVFAAVNRRLPRASRATVYNALRALREAGLIQEVRFDAAVARYEVNLMPHHHFICRVCGGFEDVAAADVQPRVRLKDGYQVEGCELTVRGVCATCGERGQPRRARQRV